MERPARLGIPPWGPGYAQDPARGPITCMTGAVVGAGAPGSGGSVALENRESGDKRVGPLRRALPLTVLMALAPGAALLAQEQAPPAAAAPALAPGNWWLLDAAADHFYGTSAERAYHDLLAGRRPARAVVVAISYSSNRGEPGSRSAYTPCRSRRARSRSDR